MTRLIKWLRANPPASLAAHESYFEKLLRFVPGDIIAGYVALDAAIRDQASDSIALYWIVFAALTILTPLYICYIRIPPPGIQASKAFPAVAGVFAFVVWVFALGGPFEVTFTHWYRPIYGSIALILTTLAIPVLESVIFKDGAPEE